MQHSFGVKAGCTLSNHHALDDQDTFLSGAETDIWSCTVHLLLSFFNPLSSYQNKQLPNTVLVLPELMAGGVLLNWSDGSITFCIFLSLHELCKRDNSL